EHPLAQLGQQHAGYFVERGRLAVLEQKIEQVERLLPHRGAEFILRRGRGVLRGQTLVERVQRELQVPADLLHQRRLVRATATRPLKGEVHRQYDPPALRERVGQRRVRIDHALAHV